MKWIGFMIVFAWLVGCNDHGDTWYYTARSVSVQGSVELYQPSNKHPVRILMVFDGSQSMLVTDPDFNRVTAAVALVNRYAPASFVSFGLIRFSSEAEALTGDDQNGDGIIDRIFTNDLGYLKEAMAGLYETGGNTNYEDALALVHSTLVGELESQTRELRARTRYHVVFLSDGMPYPHDRNSGPNSPEHIRQLVKMAAELENIYGAAELKFHFAYLAAGVPESVREEAADFLSGLASIAGGEYLEFESGEEIDFTGIEFFPSISRMPPMPVLALNLNAHSGPDGPQPDTDGDGLDDEFERQSGLDPLEADTDGDGYGDLIELLSSGQLDPLWGNLCPDRTDTDGDLLAACEEIEMGTDPFRADTDGDGLPDGVEIRQGSNPLLVDPVPELWMRSDYPSVVKSDNDSQAWMEFQVDRVPLFSTPSGQNLILVWVDTMPNSEGMDPDRFKVACVLTLGRAESLPGLYHLQPSDFVAPADLDLTRPDRTCTTIPEGE